VDEAFQDYAALWKRKWASGQRPEGGRGGDAAA